MHWIALAAPIWPEAGQAHPPERPPVASDWQALGWWALRFTPRVVCLRDAVLLEVSASLRLFGGARALLRALLHPEIGQPQPSRWARGPSARSALARLRAHAHEPSNSRAQFASRCPDTPLDELPLGTLDEACAHLPVLQALGCRQWGHLRRLPRSGLVRRFGASLLQALDQAYGESPQPWAWLELPTVYDQTIELEETVDTAPALMFVVRRLLLGLQAWLRLRHLGVLTLHLEGTYDHRQAQVQQPCALLALPLSTAEPQQLMAHLERLVAERLQRVVLAAPVSRLRLRTQDLAPLVAPPGSIFGAALPPNTQQAGSQEVTADAAATPSLYPTLSALVERLASRLGDASVLRAAFHADARLEARQVWLPALAARPSQEMTVSPRPAKVQSLRRSARQPLALHSASAPHLAQADPEAATQDPRLWPTWLLEQPTPLSLAQGLPQAPGPVSLRAGPQRLEAAHWPAPPEAGDPSTRLQTIRTALPTALAKPAALRDYHIAHSEQAGWLWVYRERLQAGSGMERWFLHGRFA